MPYDKTRELTDSTRDNLPGGAQEIDRKAFNNAWGEYADQDDRSETGLGPILARVALEGDVPADIRGRRRRGVRPGGRHDRR